VIRIAFILLMTACEYSKTPHVNPREKARIESENRKGDQDQEINSLIKKDGAQLSLVESALSMDSVLIDGVLNAEATAGAGVSYLADNCLMQQRLSQVRQASARLKQYSCIVRSSVDLAANALTKVRYGSTDYQVRAVKNADGSVSVDICENGKLKAELSHNKTDSEQVSGKFAIQGYELQDGRVAAMTGDYRIQSAESRLSLRLIAFNGDTVETGIRFAMFRQKDVKEFYSFGGRDLKLEPQSLTIASKFDAALGLGQILVGLPEAQSARRGVFNAQGHWVSGSGAKDAEFGPGGVMHINSDHLSQPLDLAYKVGLTGDWDCRLSDDISLTELVENNCPSTPLSQNDCGKPQFRASEPTTTPKFQNLTARFDQLEFDIF
jgi:hypothetical protein